MTTGFTADKAGRKVIDKAPDAVLDYVEDWTEWLDAVGETILSRTVTVTGDDAALAKASDTVDGTGKKVFAWLTGGTVGVKYAVKVQIQTATRTDSRYFLVNVKERAA